MTCKTIPNLAVFLLFPALCPVAVLAQSSQRADATIREPSPDSVSGQSASTGSLPQLAADYAKALSVLDDARQRRTESLGDLQRARGRARREMLESGEVEQARVALAQAQDQYNRERERVIDGLQSNPAYVSDRKKAADVDAKIASLRQRGDVGNDQVTVLATQRLHYAAEADQIDQNALEKDAAYPQARERYLAALHRYQSALDQVERRVEVDPDVQETKERWQEARDDWQDARTRLAAAQAAYVTALDEHRENMHYLQTHGPNDPWYPYGWGYGGYGVVVH